MDINKYISSGNIEMYVLGLCSTEEKTELENLRSQYPELNEAIVRFEKELENNLLANATMTNIETDKKITASFNIPPPPVLQLHSAQIKTGSITWLKMLAAVALILLATSVFFNYSLYKKTTNQQLLLKQQEKYSALPTEDYNILKQPSITPVAMYGVAPHNICRCTMFWDKKTGKAYIMIHHLVPSSPGNNYQLWAIVEGRIVNVGVVNDTIRDRFIEMKNLPANATAFIVTKEKQGNDTTPTLEETYLSGRI